MTIRKRLEDARALSLDGSQDGAFTMVLIAAAATSRKRYPHPKYKDNEAFKNFIYDEMGVITEGAKYGVKLPFMGKDTPLENILYKHLRCQLVHEGELPESIIFTEPAYQGGEVHHTLSLGTPLGFPAGWVEHIATAVWLAPENDELWPDEVDEREKARRQYGKLLWDRTYCRRPAD